MKVTSYREAPAVRPQSKRYFFDIREDDEVVIDEEGLVFASVEDVQEEAARSLADIAQDAVRAGASQGIGRHHMAIEVRGRCRASAPSHAHICCTTAQALGSVDNYRIHKAATSPLARFMVLVGRCSLLSLPMPTVWLVLCDAGPDPASFRFAVRPVVSHGPANAVRRSRQRPSSR
jgi:hypothetical protein